MKSYTSQSSVLRLITSQGLNAFGDHLAKIVASSLVAATFAERQASILVGVISFLYIVPYIAFAPVVGKLTQRFSKPSIVKASLLVQALAMGGLAVSAWLESFTGVLVALAIVAVQSCFLAPARNSLLKDYAGIQKIGQAMGLIALVGVSATLVGLALGGWSFDYLWTNLGNVWIATAVVGLTACGLAVLAYIVVAGLPSSDAILETGGESFESVFKELISRPAMRWSSLGLAWFYGVGAMLVMLLLQDGRWDHGQEAGAASQGGVMAALLGIGVAVGSGLAAYVCRKRVEVGLSFVGALGLMVFTPITAVFWESDLFSSIGIVIVGLFGGMFSAPLSALFISLARDEIRSTSIAANNLIINVMTGGFIGLGALLSYLQWSPAEQLYVIGASSVVVVIWMGCLVPESLIRLALLTLVRVVYPIRLKGMENLPSEGGVLIVANHVSYMDAALIYAVSGRPVRFVGTDQLLRYPWMKWAYQRFNVIAVSPTHAKDAVKKTVKALKEGCVVCVFPEGALTRTGMIMPFKKGAELMARLAVVPVVPACIDGMWGSMFSFADKPFRYRSGMPLRRSLRISFGEAIAKGQATTQVMQGAVMKLGYETFSGRRAFGENLGLPVLRTLAAKPLATRFVDKGMGGIMCRGNAFAALSLGFSRLIKNHTKARRVGLLLPPSLPGFACNVGALWAGVSVVNLNPTVSRDSFLSAVRDAGLDTVFTSKALLKRFFDLPLDNLKVLCVEDFAKELKGVRAIFDAMAVTLLPSRWLIRLYGLPARGGDREATVLFSSGSSAEPKGIPLSHKNLLSNVAQLSECYLMKSKDTILSNLPLFHSFGLTGGLWLPLLKGMKIVATPTPLNVKMNISAIRSEQVNVILGTPTFLRPYLKKATPEDFASVRLTIAGAEALPNLLREQWEARFESPILEGYGLTECSPVVAANCLHSFEMLINGGLHQSGFKHGTVGRALPGVWIRIVSETDMSRVVDANESGLILVKAPNVFRGYLNSALNAERFVEDGWMNTGDIGRMDKDGYLKIEGRQSRFSKIAGEMVSHQSVELAIERAYPEWDDVKGEGPVLVITARESERKGEELVALSRVAIDARELGRRLRGLGVPNLWMPQAIFAVDAIPCLGSGKVDLKRCAVLCV